MAATHLRVSHPQPLQGLAHLRGARSVAQPGTTVCTAAIPPRLPILSRSHRATPSRGTSRPCAQSLSGRRQGRGLCDPSQAAARRPGSSAARAAAGGEIVNPALEGGWGGDGPPPPPTGGGGGGSDSGGSSGAGEGGAGEAWWARYCVLVERHPILTKGITAALLNVIADLVCQLVVEKSRTVDIQRTLGFAAIGLFLVGPSLHIWYGLLPRVISVPGNMGTLLRLFVDQGIFAPMSLVCFIAIVLTLEGRPGDVIPKLKKDLLSTVTAQWKLWLPFQYLNFRFCPPSLQVATAGLVGLAWTVYISAVSHSGLPPKAAGSEPLPQEAKLATA